METSRASASTNASQHYSVLLETVSDLRNDLERSLNKMKSLEAQNKQLQVNYQEVKEELVETRKKYNEAQENYMSTVANKFDMERQNESFMEMIKIQLADKTKEFEAVREKFQPQDIDFIRIKIQEELEIPHRQKIQELTNELEAQQDLYNISQRELARLHAEHDVYVENQQREHLQLRHEHENEIQSLRSSIMILEERSYQQDKDEQIRSHKFRMQELENTVDGLRAEIKSMQMERDEQATMADKEKTRIEQQNVTMRSKLNHSETERLASNMKVDNLLADIDTKDSLLRSYKKTIDEQALRIETLNTNYNDCVAKAAVIKEEFLNQISNESTAHEAAQRELTAQNDELLSKLYDREAIIRKLQRETSEFQIRSERKEHDIRKEMNLVIQEHKHMNHTLELECTDLKHQLRSSSDNFNNMAAQSEQEVDRIRNENSRIVREKEMLLNKIREAEQRYETTRKSEQDVKRNLSEKLFTTQQEVVRLQNIIKNNTTTHEQLNQTISKYENEINNQKNQLKKIETEHAQAVENMNRNSKEKMDNLMNAYKEKLRNVQEHYRKINEKEKKKSEAYKEKAIEAHNTNKILNSNIEAMQAMADL